MSESIKEKYEESIEYNTIVAEHLIQVLVPIDILLARFDIRDLKKVLSKMQSQTSTLEAWPFPETMKKANITRAKNKVFELIVKLAETRQDQRKIEQEEETRSEGHKKILEELGV